MKFIKTSRLHLAVGAAVLGLVACGGGDGDGPFGPLVAGTEVPVSATIDFQAATDFVASIVNAGGSETAEPIIIGDVTLATSETEEPDPRI